MIRFLWEKCLSRKLCLLFCFLWKLVHINYCWMMLLHYFVITAFLNNYVQCIKSTFNLQYQVNFISKFHASFVVGAQYESSSPERVGRHVHQVWWRHARDVSSSCQGNSSSAAWGSQEGIGCQGNLLLKYIQQLNTCTSTCKSDIWFGTYIFLESQQMQCRLSIIVTVIEILFLLRTT